MAIFLAFAMGIVAGLRSMTPLAVISWAVSLGWFRLDDTPLSILGAPAAKYVLGALAVGELIADKLAKAPSRKSAGPFIFRILIGIVSGLALTQISAIGAVAGALGAVCGTLGGYQARTGIVKALSFPDWPVAVAEDVVAIGCGFLIASRAA